jgi:hypothetical protein
MISYIDFPLKIIAMLRTLRARDAARLCKAEMHAQGTETADVWFRLQAQKVCDAPRSAYAKPLFNS